MLERPCRLLSGIALAVLAAAPASAQSVRLITAHCREDEDNLDWPALAREKQTLAFYMGVGQLDLLTRRLLAHGRGRRTAGRGDSFFHASANDSSS